MPSISAHHQLLLLLQGTVLQQVTCALQGLLPATTSTTGSSPGSSSSGSSGNGSHQAGNAASSSRPVVSSPSEPEMLQAAGKVACRATKAFISTLHQLRGEIPKLPLKLLQRRLEGLAQSMSACGLQEPPCEQHSSSMAASGNNAADSASWSSSSAASIRERLDPRSASRLGKGSLGLSSKLRRGEGDVSNLGCKQHATLVGKQGEVLLQWDWFEGYKPLANLLAEVKVLPGLPRCIFIEACALEQAALAAAGAAVGWGTAGLASASCNELEGALQQHLVTAKSEELLESLQLWQAYLEQQQQQQEQLFWAIEGLCRVRQEPAGKQQGSGRGEERQAQMFTAGTLPFIIEQLSAGNQRYQQAGGKVILQQLRAKYQPLWKGRATRVLEWLLLWGSERPSREAWEEFARAASDRCVLEEPPINLQDALMLLELLPLLWPRGPLPMVGNMLLAWCMMTALGVPHACHWFRCCRGCALAGLAFKAEHCVKGIGGKEGALRKINLGLSSEECMGKGKAWCKALDQQVEGLLLIERRLAEGSAAPTSHAGLLHERDMWVREGAVGLQPGMRGLMQAWQVREKAWGWISEDPGMAACWDPRRDSDFMLGYAQQRADLEGGFRHLLYCMAVEQKVNVSLQHDFEQQQQQRQHAQDICNQRKGLSEFLEYATLTVRQPRAVAAVAAADNTAAAAAAAGSRQACRSRQGAAAGKEVTRACRGMAGHLGQVLSSEARTRAEEVRSAAAAAGSSEAPVKPLHAAAACMVSEPGADGALDAFAVVTASYPDSKAAAAVASMQKGGAGTRAEGALAVVPQLGLVGAEGCLGGGFPSVPSLVQENRDAGLGVVPEERMLLVTAISKGRAPAACNGGRCSSWSECYQSVSSLLEQLLELEGLPPELQQKASMVVQLEQVAANALTSANCNAIEVELCLQLGLAEGCELTQLLREQQQQEEEEKQQQLQQGQLQQQLEDEQQYQRESFRVPPDLLKQLLLVLGTNEERCRTAADVHLQQQLEAYRAWWEEESLKVMQKLVSAGLSAGAATWGEAVRAFAAPEANLESSSESLSLALHLTHGVTLLFFVTFLWPEDMPVAAFLLLAMCQLTGLGPLAAGLSFCMTGAAACLAKRAAAAEEAVQQGTDLGDQHGRVSTSPGRDPCSMGAEASNRLHMLADTWAMVLHTRARIAHLVQKRLHGLLDQPASLQMCSQFLKHALDGRLSPLDPAVVVLTRWEQKEKVENGSGQGVAEWDPQRDAVLMKALAVFQEEFAAQLWEAGGLLVEHYAVVKAREQQGKLKPATKEEHRRYIRDAMKAVFPELITAMSEAGSLEGPAGAIASINLLAAPHHELSGLLLFGVGGGQEVSSCGWDLRAALSDQQGQQPQAERSAALDSTKFPSDHQQLLQSAAFCGDVSQQGQAPAAPAGATLGKTAQTQRTGIRGGSSCKGLPTAGAEGDMCVPGVDAAEQRSCVKAGAREFIKQEQPLQLQQQGAGEGSGKGCDDGAVERQSSEGSSLGWFAVYKPISEHIQSFLQKHKEMPEVVLNAAKAFLRFEPLYCAAFAETGTCSNGAEGLPSWEGGVRLQLQQHLLCFQGKSLLSSLLRWQQMEDQKQQQIQQEQPQQQQKVISLTREQLLATKAAEAAAKAKVLQEDIQHLCSQLLSNQQRCKQAGADEQFKKQQGVYQSQWKQRAYLVLTALLSELKQDEFNGRTSAAFKDAQELSGFSHMLWPGGRAAPGLATLLVACCNLVSIGAVEASYLLHKHYGKVEKALMEAAGGGGGGKEIRDGAGGEQQAQQQHLTPGSWSRWKAFASQVQARLLLGQLLKCGDNTCLLTWVHDWCDHVPGQRIPADSPAARAMRLWVHKSKAGAAARIDVGFGYGAAAPPVTASSRGSHRKPCMPRKWDPASDQELLIAVESLDRELKPALLQVLSDGLSALSAVEVEQQQVQLPQEGGLRCVCAATSSTTGHYSSDCSSANHCCTSSSAWCLELGGCLEGSVCSTAIKKAIMQQHDRRQQQQQNSSDTAPICGLEKASSSSGSSKAALPVMSVEWGPTEGEREQTLADAAKQQERRQQQLDNSEQQQQQPENNKHQQQLELEKGQEAPGERRRLQAKRLAPAGGKIASASLHATAEDTESLQQDSSAAAAAAGDRSSSSRNGRISCLVLGESGVIAAKDVQAAAGVAEQLLAVWEAVDKLSAAQTRMMKQRDEMANESRTQQGSQDHCASVDEYYAQKWAGWRSFLPLAAARQQLRLSLGAIGKRVPLSVFDGNLDRADAQLSGSDLDWTSANSTGLLGTSKPEGRTRERTNSGRGGGCCASNSTQCSRSLEQQKQQGISWGWDGTGFVQKMPVLQGPLGAAIPQLLLHGLSGADAEDLPHALTAALKQGPKSAGAGLATQVDWLVEREVELGQEQQRACELAALQLLLHAGVVQGTWAVADGPAEAQGSLVGLTSLLAEHAKLPSTERKKVTVI